MAQLSTTGSITTRDCRACGAGVAVRADFERGDKAVRLTGYCALCLARAVDAAYGWRIASNVAQGLVAFELGQGLRAEKRRRRNAEEAAARAG